MEWSLMLTCTFRINGGAVAAAIDVVDVVVVVGGGGGRGRGLQQQLNSPPPSPQAGHAISDFGGVGFLSRIGSWEISNFLTKLRSVSPLPSHHTFVVYTRRDP